MIRKMHLFIKAVPAILVGIAFFLSGCQPKLPVPRHVETTTSDLFTTAEAQFEKGDLEKALKNYEAFVNEKPGNRKQVFAFQRIVEIHMKQHQEKEALTALEQIERQYPDYTWMAQVKYQ
ncbi:MAG TPA: tetratricopeptide repeat protein, partial [Deltaproteobacteria bacterium]|nr:tetratricopeptide repeat protein [Deltaproteobacteria bacterium]